MTLWGKFNPGVTYRWGRCVPGLQKCLLFTACGTSIPTGCATRGNGEGTDRGRKKKKGLRKAANAPTDSHKSAQTWQLRHVNKICATKLHKIALWDRTKKEHAFLRLTLRNKPQGCCAAFSFYAYRMTKIAFDSHLNGTQLQGSI